MLKNCPGMTVQNSDESFDIIKNGGYSGITHKRNISDFGKFANVIRGVTRFDAVSSEKCSRAPASPYWIRLDRLIYLFSQMMLKNCPGMTVQNSDESFDIIKNGGYSGITHKRNISDFGEFANVIRSVARIDAVSSEKCSKAPASLYWIWLDRLIHLIFSNYVGKLPWNDCSKFL
ncbi:hypothetical protein JTB14_001324 [Gonioctena quinquepunctata]|nr:hypothetical protein JTB14_001324 [Gonioctena quinquepunctata]